MKWYLKCTLLESRQGCNNKAVNIAFVFWCLVVSSLCDRMGSLISLPGDSCRFVRAEQGTHTDNSTQHQPHNISRAQRTNLNPAAPASRAGPKEPTTRQSAAQLLLASTSLKLGLPSNHPPVQNLSLTHTWASSDVLLLTPESRAPYESLSCPSASSLWARQTQGAQLLLTHLDPMHASCVPLLDSSW